MPKLILGLVGQAGCGKGTVVDILREKYGADYTRFSSIMGDILMRLHLEKTRSNFIKLSETLRHTFGEDVFSYALEGEVVTSLKDVVVIDGIRRLDDIVALEPLPNFKLVAIDAPAKLRYERMKKRGEKASETEMTWERFLEEEKGSTEVTIPGVMARAWKTISNAGTREELETTVHQMMKELGF